MGEFLDASKLFLVDTSFGSSQFYQIGSTNVEEAIRQLEDLGVSIPRLDDPPSSRDRFFIDGEVSDEIHDGLVDGVANARQWFDGYNIPIPDSISVHASNNPDSLIDLYFQHRPISPAQMEAERQNLRLATIWSGTGRIYVNTASEGWLRASSIIGGPIVQGRLHLIASHMFSTSLYETGAYNRPPVAWMEAGSRHYLGAVMLDETGEYNYELIRGGHVREAISVTEPLQSLESAQNFYRAGNPATADEFSLAFMALEYTVRDLPNRGIDAVVDYWNRIGRGESHKVAFEASFRRGNFYTDFENYRQQGFPLE